MCVCVCVFVCVFVVSAKCCYFHSLFSIFLFIFIILISCILIMNGTSLKSTILHFVNMNASFL